MPLDAGSRLGPYEILALLGKGGMGEVYRARDTRLGRSVAIKILPEDLAQDPQRSSRFEREARVVASLAHPNICTLHDVGRHDRVAFLVMELLDGTTLDHRLRSGPLEIAEALDCAIQIAEALDAAHRQGVIHRDLKPANVMLTKSGLKLLDFGLARFGQSDMPGEESPTRSTPLTGSAEILGTLPYMAPEQLEGKPTDSRTDLFAFGAVLHEMITGQRAFVGTSQASIIGAILHTSPPPLTASRPEAPPALDYVLSRCLAKDPQARWSTAHDVLLCLRWIAGSQPAPEASAAGAVARRPRLAWALALVALGLIALAVAILAGRGDGGREDAGRRVLSVLPPAETALGASEAPEISPDGRKLAFVATDKAGRSLLYVRDLGEPTARPLSGTDGASLPFWSPDSRRLGFFADGQLKTIPASGGSPLTIARASTSRGGSWSSKDLILFVAQPSQPPLMVLPVGGEATPVPVRREEQRRFFPRFLPDGRHYLYLALGPNAAGFSAMVGSIDSPETKEVIAASGSVAFASSGHLFFRRGAALFAQPFDVAKLAVTGSPVPVADTVGFNSITFQGLFSVSDSGVVALLESASGAQPVWFDRQGNQQGEAAPDGSYNTLCITPDQKRIIYDQVDSQSGNVDLWSRDLAGGPATRQTFDPAVDFYPVCSPAGDNLIFTSLRGGRPSMYLQELSAPGSEKAILAPTTPTVATDWSRDGRLVVYSILSEGSSWDVGLMPLAGGDSILVAGTAAEERNARLSPDGKWLTYVSNESGRFEVYIQPIPATGARWQVSRSGGYQPQWRSDGGEVYYIAPDKKLMAATVKSDGSGLALGEPVTLMETRITGLQQLPQASQYSVSADGKRFLVVTPTTTGTPITVILDWQAPPGS